MGLCIDFFFSLWTSSLPFLSFGGGREKCSFLFVGIYHRKHHPTVPEGIKSLTALSSKVSSFLNLTLLFCHFTPTGQPGTRCDNEVFGLSRSRGLISNL